MRRFPDTLYVEFVKRQPCFQINIGGKLWLVDREYTVISDLKEGPLSGEITVYGLLAKDLGIAIGKKIPLPFSSNIVSLLDELKNQGFSSNFNISSLYAYSLNDIWFDLDGVEIRVGDTDYKEKLRLLRTLILPRFESDFSRIRYIDLRFNPPVMDYKR